MQTGRMDKLPHLIRKDNGYIYSGAEKDLHWYFIPYGSYEKLLNQIGDRDFVLSPIFEDKCLPCRLSRFQIDVYQLAGMGERYCMMIRPDTLSLEEFWRLLILYRISPLDSLPFIVGVECPRTYVARIRFSKFSIKHVL